MDIIELVLDLERRIVELERGTEDEEETVQTQGEL